MNNSGIWICNFVEEFAGIIVECELSRLARIRIETNSNVRLTTILVIQNLVEGVAGGNNSELPFLRTFVYQSGSSLISVSIE